MRNIDAKMRIIDAKELMRDIGRIRDNLMACGYGKEANAVSLAMGFLKDWINEHEICVSRTFPQEDEEDDVQ